MSDELNTLRQQIDSLDREILAKLNARARLAADIGRIKQRENAPIYVPAREEALLCKLADLSEGPLQEAAIRSIFREIISASIALEKTLQIAYLGPQATYTQQAARKNFGSSVSYLPLGSIPDVFEAVERQEADYGVVPIENSSEGGVFHSMDMLVESDLCIVAEVYLPIEHCLISGSAQEKITRIYSKDQALGQCRNWLRRHLPDAQLIASASTAQDIEAARGDSGTAVIASALVAEQYGVPLVAKGIQDKSDNTTRFLVIGREQCACPSPQGGDKTSLLLTVNDEPSALQRALGAFGSRNINMSKIESRPSRRKAWDYVFFVDIEGHWQDESVQAAVSELRQCCPFVKWLGSYPGAKR